MFRFVFFVIWIVHCSCTIAIRSVFVSETLLILTEVSYHLDQWTGLSSIRFHMPHKRDHKFYDPIKWKFIKRSQHFATRNQEVCEENDFLVRHFSNCNVNIAYFSFQVSSLLYQCAGRRNRPLQVLF